MWVDDVMTKEAIIKAKVLKQPYYYDPIKIEGEDFRNSLLVSAIKSVETLYGIEIKDKILEALNIDRDWFLNSSNSHHWQFHYFFWQTLEDMIGDNFDIEIILKEVFSRSSDSRISRFISYCSSPEFFIKNVHRVISYFNKIQKYKSKYEYKKNRTYYHLTAVTTKEVNPEAGLLIYKLNEISLKYIFLQIFGVKGYKVHKSEYFEENHKASFTVS